MTTPTHEHVLHPFDNPTATYAELVAAGLPGCAVTRSMTGFGESVMVTPEATPVLGVTLAQRGAVWVGEVHGTAATSRAATPREAVLEATVAWEVAGAVQILRRVEEVTVAMRMLRETVGGK